MYDTADIICRTNWEDPDGRSQARAIDYIWEQRHAKYDLEARAAQNYAFYEGLQLYEWNDYQRQMVLPGRYSGPHAPKVLDEITFNTCKYLINQKLAKFSRSEPIWSVPSYTSDEFDQTVARFSNDLMAWQAIHNLRIPALNDQFLRHAFCSPAVWLDAYWDTSKGDPIATTLDDYLGDSEQAPDNASPEMYAEYEARNMQRRDEAIERYRSMRAFEGVDTDGSLKPLVQYSGDAAINIRTIFDVTWYPFEFLDWADVDAYLVSTVMTPEKIRARYRIPYEEIKGHRNSADVAERHERMRGAFSSPYFDRPYVGESYDSGVLVHQLHVSKRAAPPYGMTCVKLGSSNRCIPGQWGPSIDPLGRMPLIGFSEYPGLTHAIGTCTMDDLIAPQIEINDSLTKARKLRRNRVNAKVIRKKEDGSHPDALKDDDYDYEVNDMNNRPQVLQLPTEGFEEAKAIETSIRFMQDSSGVPDISLGRNDQSDVQSGKAIIALKSGSYEILSTTGRMLNVLWSDVGSRILMLFQHYAIENRITGIVGEDKRLTYRQWSAADLRPTSFDQFPDKTANVIVETFSNIPRSPAEREAMLFNVLKLGVIEDQKVVKRLVARVVDMNDVESLFDPSEQARDRASDNLRRWQMGEPVQPPNPHQDHDEFIDVYTKFVNGDDFMTLGQRNPRGAAEMLSAIEQHKQLRDQRDAMDVVRKQMALAEVSFNGAQSLMRKGMLGAAEMLLLQSAMLGGSAQKPPIGGNPEPKPQKPNEKSGDRESAAPNGQGDGNRPNPSATDAMSPAAGAGQLTGA